MSKDIAKNQDLSKIVQKNDQISLNPVDIDIYMMVDTFLNEIGNKLTLYDGLLYLLKKKQIKTDFYVKKATNSLIYMKIILNNMRLCYKKDLIQITPKMSTKMIEILDKAKHQFNVIVQNEKIQINYYNIQETDIIKGSYLLQLAFFNLFSFIYHFLNFPDNSDSSSTKQRHDLQVILHNESLYDESYYHLSISCDPSFIITREQINKIQNSLHSVEQMQSILNNDFYLSFPLMCLSVSLDIFATFDIKVTLQHSNYTDLTQRTDSFHLFIPTPK